MLIQSIKYSYPCANASNPILYKRNSALLDRKQRLSFYLVEANRIRKLTIQFDFDATQLARQNIGYNIVGAQNKIPYVIR